MKTLEASKPDLILQKHVQKLSKQFWLKHSYANSINLQNKFYVENRENGLYITSVEYHEVMWNNIAEQWHILLSVRKY